MVSKKKKSSLKKIKRKRVQRTHKKLSYHIFNENLTPIVIPKKPSLKIFNLDNNNNNNIDDSIKRKYEKFRHFLMKKIKN